MGKVIDLFSGQEIKPKESISSNNIVDAHMLNVPTQNKEVVNNLLSSCDQDEQNLFIKYNTQTQCDPYPLNLISPGKYFVNTHPQPNGKLSLMPSYNVRLPNNVLGSSLYTTGNDPFNWLDHKYQATKKVLRDYDREFLIIHTASDLISNDDYMQLINKQKHHVVFHVLTANDRFNRHVEPSGASLKRRLKAIAKLLANDISVSISHNMFSFLSSDFQDISEALKEYGLDHLNIIDNFIRVTKSRQEYVELTAKHLGTQHDQNEMF